MTMASRPTKAEGEGPPVAGRSAYDVESGETHELFATLARTSLYLDALQREIFREHALTFTEYSVLRLLQRAPGRRLAPSVLAEAIVCTSGAMTKVVDRLERAELVVREPDPNDRRGVLIRLQAKGGRVANAAARGYQAGRDRILSRLGKREAADIQKNLVRLLDAFEDDRGAR